MWIEVGNLHARVTRATDAERDWLGEYLSFEDQRAKFRGGCFNPHAERVRMFNLHTSSFPAGFLPMVRKAAAELSPPIQVESSDVRVRPATAATDLGWLRDYQQGAVTRALARERGILWLPTGAGKTEIAIGLVQSAPAARWLFLVHRATLAHQTAERFHLRTGEHAGVVGDGRWDAEPRFVAATFQTVYVALTKGSDADRARAMALLNNADGLLVDECHVLPADSFWKVAMRTPNAYFRIGLSGTPLARGDRRSMLAVAALGPVAYRIKPEVLIAAGVLARPRIRLLPVVQRSDHATWASVYKWCIVRSTVRNAAVVEAARRVEKPVLVFVKEISHGRALLSALRASGLNADFVWGDDSTERRQTAVRELTRGALDVLVCSVVFQEGVDIPDLRGVVIASGGMSVIAALQRIGRGMRAAAGKTEFEVYDFDDRGCGCTRGKKGDYHHGCRWIERHARARLHAYAGEGYQTVVESTAPVLPLPAR